MLIAITALLVPAAAAVGVLRRWRICLSSLAALFVLLAIIEGTAIDPLLGLAQAVAGGTAVAILFVSARQAFSNTRLPEIHRHLPTWEYLFESVVAAVAAIGALFFARVHPLFGLSGPVTFAWAWLGLSGLFMAILAANVFELGLGLLILCAGLDLLVLATSLSSSWAGLAILEMSPIGIAVLVGLLGLRLSQLGHSLTLDALKEKAPFVVGQGGPIRVKVRRRHNPLRKAGAVPEVAAWPAASGRR
ncbi:MAG: hypothetical protein ACYDAG_05080 [Chloroflexota bacterium]